jgi:hypothetical protein
MPSSMCVVLAPISYVDDRAVGYVRKLAVLNQSQGETRRVDAVGLTEAECAVRSCDGRLAQDLEAG